MQLFALDHQGKPILASAAEKKRDYICPECSLHLRVRSGVHRQPHYYHIQPNINCSQHNKGMQHLQVQWQLYSLLPNSFLEVRFPAINRIADLVWESEKVVFEVQCSPISLQEVQARNAAYGSLGYAVIWILHENRYNQRRIMAAEAHVRALGALYTDIDAEGQGIIYDQFAYFQGNYRHTRLAKLPVNVAALSRIIPMAQAHDPHAIRMRKQLPFFFSGDLLHTYLQDGNDCEYIQKIVDIEQEHSSHEEQESLIKRWLLTPYLALFRHFLEKTCR